MDDYLYHQSVHKDFHGVLSFIFEYLKDNFGNESTEDIYRYIAKQVYQPLIHEIRQNGLKEMERHLSQIMEIEEGESASKWENGRLIVEIKECPAIRHMKERGFQISDDFCHLSTELINQVLAEEGGYNFQVDYDQKAGHCIQSFWEEGR